jgi:hypothetical protein
MAYRYEHPDGPEYGRCVELSAAEYDLIVRALYTKLEQVVHVRASGIDSLAARAANDEHDLTEFLKDLDPILDD